jgi:nucleotide-binding universal stress UspA family protein
VESGSSLGVVVGYDGSPESELALAWAADAARGSCRPLDVVVVGTHMDPVVGTFRERSDRVLDQQCARAHRALDALDLAHAPVRVRRGPTAPVLVAEARGAAFLVVGSPGQDQVRGRLAGSVSQYVAQHTTVPVVVVRPTGSPRAPRIVVGVDGSRQSSRALAFACGKAVEDGSEVVIVHSYRRGPLVLRGEFRVQHPGRVRDTAYALLDQAAALTASDFPGLSVSTVAVAGSPGRVLVERSRSAFLVVVGSRGRDPVEGLLLGSVSRHVLRHALCTVAVVP